MHKRHIKRLAECHNVPYGYLCDVILNKSLEMSTSDMVDPSIEVCKERFAAAQAVMYKYGGRATFKFNSTPIKTELGVYARNHLQVRRLLCDFPGEHYSGNTRWELRLIKLGTTPYAKTETSNGNRYSRRVYYTRTDAVHIFGVNLSNMVRVRALGLPASIEGWSVVRANQTRPGVFCVDLIGSLRKRATYKQQYAVQTDTGGWRTYKTESGAARALPSLIH